MPSKKSKLTLDGYYFYDNKSYHLYKDENGNIIYKKQLNNNLMTIPKKLIYNALEKISGTSLGRTIIYTMGHIGIAMICNRIITGANWWLAGADAIIEPLVNGFWYYFLDKTWSKLSK